MPSTKSGDWVVVQATKVPGVELLRAHFIRHSFERHSHEGWSIGVTMDGNQTYRCRGAMNTSRKGNLIVFRPDEAHDGHGEDEDGFKYAMLYLPDSLIESWLRESGTRNRHPLFRAPLIDDPLCASALVHAVDTLTQGKESLHADASICRAILEIFSKHAGHVPNVTPEKPSAAWLAIVREYLDANYFEDVTVEDLATAAGVSRVHLTRAFADKFGVPPHVYLNSVRLRAAKGLLARGEPLVNVAIEAGFADQSHFTRRFRGSFGLTPSDWVQQMRRKPS